MANALYPLWKEALLSAAANSELVAGTVKIALVDTAVSTYSAAHQFFSSVSAAVIGTPQTLGTKTVSGGVFDAADPTFTAVSGASVEALVVYIDTGVAGTSRLVAYIDTGVTGLPVTPNGGNIALAFDSGANKIFAV